MVVRHQLFEHERLPAITSSFSKTQGYLHFFCLPLTPNKRPHYILTTCQQLRIMPNPIPEVQISNFLSQQTCPLLISSLPNDSSTDLQCPVCRYNYSDPPSTYVHPDFPDDLPEYACQIQGRGSCTHVFGRHCLENHIRSDGPWSHVCPLCRQEWFHPPNARRTEVLGHVESALNVLAGMGRDDGLRREVEEVEEVDRGLRAIREILYEGRRWI